MEGIEPVLSRQLPWWSGPSCFDSLVRHAVTANRRDMGTIRKSVALTSALARDLARHAVLALE